jgi:hypothetical protein
VDLRVYGWQAVTPTMLAAGSYICRTDPSLS